MKVPHVHLCAQEAAGAEQVKWAVAFTKAGAFQGGRFRRKHLLVGAAAWQCHLAVAHTPTSRRSQQAGSSLRSECTCSRPWHCSLSLVPAGAASWAWAVGGQELRSSRSPGFVTGEARASSHRGLCVESHCSAAVASCGMLSSELDALRSHLGFLIPDGFPQGPRSSSPGLRPPDGLGGPLGLEARRGRQRTAHRAAAREQSCPLSCSCSFQPGASGEPPGAPGQGWPSPASLATSSSCPPPPPRLPLPPPSVLFPCRPPPRLPSFLTHLSCSLRVLGHWGDGRDRKEERDRTPVFPGTVLGPGPASHGFL